MLEDATSTGPSYAVALLQTLLALAAVSMLAWVALRFFARRGWGVGRSAGHLKVVDRLVLDHRRALHLVRVADRVVLIGTGEGSAPRLLLEMSASALQGDPNEAPAGSLTQVLTETPAAASATSRGSSPGDQSA